MYCFLAFVRVYLYAYCCALFLAMCSWEDVELPEEPQYQYPEQPTSDQFEQQQEQYEEGKYNMNTTYHFKYNFILHLILYAYKDFLATLYPLYISFGLHFG